jgi:hypothetical protein
MPRRMVNYYADKKVGKVYLSLDGSGRERVLEKSK